MLVPRLCLGTFSEVALPRAYVQFRGSEFHTRNARSRQLQEQRRAKADLPERTREKTLMKIAQAISEILIN